MRSFKDYQKAETKTEGETVNAETLAQKLMQAYSGKSDAEMWRGILAEAEKSKRAGTLSNEEIDAFYQSFAPMLDGSQRKMLKSVVERLKKL